MSTPLQIQRRKQTALTLIGAGLTHAEVAKRLGVSTKTIERDIVDAFPALEKAAELLTAINSEFEELQSPRKIAENYVALAEKDSNGSVRLTAQDRILEYRGIVTEKERFRRDKGTESQPAPMFTLHPGASVNVTVNQVQQAQPTASCSSEPTIDVTPISRSSEPE